MTEATDPKNPSWKESYKAVRNPMRDLQTAHDIATATGSAKVKVDGEEYVVTRDSAGRNVTPAAPEAPQEQPKA